ncbi:MAG: sensor histidine kinase [Flavobacteriaceae bacterium]|nr:sensor histidine kinase [Mangrovimonas sp.]MCB0439048.1 sensor histidine kinase [Mangrovimonas sp.]
MYFYSAINQYIKKKHWELKLYFAKPSAFFYTYNLRLLPAFVFLCFACPVQSQNLDSLFQVARTIKNDSARIRQYNKLASAYLFNDAKKALEIIKEGEQMAIEKAFAFGLVELTNTHGIYMDITGKSDSAEYYFNKALKLSQEHHFKNIEVMCVNNLGMFNWNQGNYSEALNYFFQSLKMYEEQGNEKGTSSPLNNIGLIYQDMNLPNKALEYHEKALKIREEYALETEQVGSLNNIGINLRRLDRFEEAVTVFEKGLKLAEKTNNLIGYYKILDNLASVYQELGNYDKAITYYFKALEKPEGYEYDEKDDISIYVNLISLYNHKNQPKEALKYAEKAFAIIEQNPAEKKVNSKLYLNAAESHFMLYQLNEARKLTKEFVTIKDSLFSEENAKAVADLEVKYDTEKKEKQILVHRAELAEQQLVIQNKNYQIYGMVALAVLLIVVGFLLYNQQKLKNRQLKKENELKDALLKIETQSRLQEQRLRISRDLHDNIGSQLTFIISSLDNLQYGFNIENEALKGKLQSISEFTSSTITDLRDTIWAMNKSEISLDDLHSRISNFIDKARIASRTINFNFNITDESRNGQSFSSVEGMNIYRVIQEAINNSIKHANATKIDIDVTLTDTSLKLKIRDNGKGFELDKERKGNGISNMKSRVSDLGGKIDFKSFLGEGTEISVTFKR